MDIEHYLQKVRECAETYAEAKGLVTFLEDYRPAVKALNMKEAARAGHTTAAAQEREALASTDYGDHLRALRYAVRDAEKARVELRLADRAMDFYLDREATKRAEMKGYSS